MSRSRSPKKFSFRAAHRRSAKSRRLRTAVEQTRLAVEPLEVRRLLATFIVNSTGNEPDSFLGDGFPDTANNPNSDPPTPASGIVTLRAAIMQANANVGPDTIHFAIPGGGTPVIDVAAELPSILETIVIDGTTQPGGFVELRGPGAATNVDGLELKVNSNGSVLRGLVLTNFREAIRISSNNNIVAGNLIGVDSTGTMAAPNLNGIDIQEGNNNTIGGVTAADRNVISANSSGVILFRFGEGPAATGNRITGNYIGTDITGAVNLGNTIQGVSIQFTSDNIIGGATDAERNVISGNGRGISVLGSLAARNLIAGNYIGVNSEGTSAIPNGVGVFINDAPEITIGGVVGDVGPIRGNLISGNTEYGVQIVNANARNIRIQGNLIGLNASGSAAVPNGFDGIYAESSGNLIGGTTDDARNVISGNLGDGVAIAGQSAAPATGNVVIGNYIGTDITGSAAVPNGFRGVHLDGFATGNFVGGTAPGERNVISGNTRDGVILALANARFNEVVGNFIGTDALGIEDLGNGGAGVYILRSPSNIIGGPDGAGNVISGNDLGVFIEGAAAEENEVLGNLIGTDVSGLMPLGNFGAGVFIVDAKNNFIGGRDVAPVPNTISANEEGVLIIEATSTGNVIRGNRIGTDVTGGRGLDPIDLPMGNNAAGVSIIDAAGNFIGDQMGADAPIDPALFPSNTISGNGLGVQITGDTALRNIVRGNSIFGNFGLGIDLNADGVTPSDQLDADLGPNERQNAPIVSLLARDEFATRVSGSLAGKSGASYRLDFYASDLSNANTMAEAYQGERYLGTHVLTVGEDGFGHFELETGLAPTEAGDVITATATDAMGNTSEFSQFTPDFEGRGLFKPRTPVIFVPGFFGSFPRDTIATEDDALYREFLLTLGIAPDKLVLDPIAKVYNDLIATLVKAGYTPGKDLFVAPYDWRLPAAPTTVAPSQQDGLIGDITSASITDTTYEYGVDYLGYWLKQAAEQWYLDYQQPLTNVHIIAHSMGGLVSRSYIQSEAYGGEFAPSVGVGVDKLVLPMVSDITMLGVPNQGGSGTYPAWFDDFGGNGAYRLVLSKLVNHAWQKMQDGAVIQKPDGGTLTREQFAGPDVAARKVDFVRAYVRGIQSVLPSYAFAQDFTPTTDSELRNLLLEDLNQTVRFPDRVARTVLLYGTSETTPVFVEQNSGPTLSELFIPINSLTSFTDINGRPPFFFEIWYDDVAVDGGGDGTVSLASLEGLFLEDDRVELVPYYAESTIWGVPVDTASRPERPNDQLSLGLVSHTGLVSNVDAQFLILSNLGHPIPLGSIKTGSALSGLFETLTVAAQSVSYSFLFDPVDAFVVDRDGNRLGYSEATGAVTEIPGSQYYGDRDGFGFISGTVRGPLTLELIGAGGEYYVQASGANNADTVGADYAGTLDVGETLSIPLDPLPGVEDLRWVENVYRHLLDRIASPAEIAYWLGELDGGATRGDVALLFLATGEYRAGLVADFYREFLGREVEAEGAAYWHSRLAEGLSQEGLLAAILASDEYYALHSGDDGEFVDSLYAALLDRDGAGEREFWLERLAEGARREDIARAFILSEEFRAELVDVSARYDFAGWYDDYLGRRAEPEGLAFWLERLLDGSGDDWSFVQAGILGSEEHFDR